MQTPPKKNILYLDSVANLNYTDSASTIKSKQLHAVPSLSDSYGAGDAI